MPVPHPHFLGFFANWFSELVLAQQVFYTIGILALVVVILQMVLMAFGAGLEGLDVDLELADGDTGGMSVISIQTLTSFFFAFGWVGGISLGRGYSFPAAFFFALVAGGIFMFCSWFLLKQILRLQSSGNLKYDTAIGETARVYVTLPGDGEDGGGQIELMLQGRLITASARKPSPGEAKPGDQVRIIGAEGTTYLVELLSQPSAP